MGPPGAVAWYQNQSSNAQTAANSRSPPVAVPVGNPQLPFACYSYSNPCTALVPPAGSVPAGSTQFLTAAQCPPGQFITQFSYVYVGNCASQLAGLTAYPDMYQNVVACGSSNCRVPQAGGGATTAVAPAPAGSPPSVKSGASGRRSASALLGGGALLFAAAAALATSGNGL